VDVTPAHRIRQEVTARGAMMTTAAASSRTDAGAHLLLRERDTVSMLSPERADPGALSENSE